MPAATWNVLSFCTGGSRFQFVSETHLDPITCRSQGYETVFVILNYVENEIILLINVKNPKDDFLLMTHLKT